MTGAATTTSRAALLAIVLALSLAAPAAGAGITPDWSGPDITSAPSIRVGLKLAHAYWHTNVPATVTVLNAPDYLGLAEMPTADGYGRHIGVTLTALALWPPGSPWRRTQLAALMVHEYGHLLGYNDRTAYSADPRRVMFEYANYLTLPCGALPGNR